MALIPTMQQIVDGLQTFGLLSVVRANPLVFHNVFCPSKGLLWNFGYVEEMLLPMFSEKGSNRHKIETECYKSLLDGLENIYECGGMSVYLITFG